MMKDALVNHYILLVLHHLVSLLVVILIRVRISRLGWRGCHSTGVSILRRRVGLTNRGFFWMGTSLRVRLFL